jgi:DNA-binding LacI/PurR family transcriptional regulator
VATRKEVAEKAGVSEAVVSYIINNSNYVNAKTRERVQKVIDELGYRPNLVARSLKIDRTHHLAFICNDFSNQFFSQIASEVTRIAFDNGYLLSITDVGYDDARIELLLQYRVDGMFICSDLFLPEQINRFVDQGTAVVLFGNREYPGLDSRVAQIEVDIKGGMIRLMEYLVSKGHTNFAFVSSALFGDHRVHMDASDNYRYTSFKDVIEANNLFGKTYRIGSVLDEESLSRHLHTIVNEQKASVIVSGNDTIACQVIAKLSKMGLSVPEDIAVTGFDGIWFANTFAPQLTTVDLKVDKIGPVAIEQLLRIIRKQPVEKAVWPSDVRIGHSA